MFSLLLPLMIAALPATPAPVPTLPPEIGSIYVRGHCNEAQTTLKKALPLLIRNDNAIGSALNGLAKVDSHEDAATRLTIVRTRTASTVIFKNIEKAKDEIMKLHVLAAASTNAQQSTEFSALADSLDSIVQQQYNVADQLNGYADTADMGLLWQGSETEHQMSNATKAGDNQSIQQADAANQAHNGQHGSMAASDIGALTTNVFRDVQGMHRDLRASYDTTTAQVQQLVRTCAPVKRKP